MQAALMLRSKQRIARNKQRRLRLGIKGNELPTCCATKDIPPYPPFPPRSWVNFFESPNAEVLEGFLMNSSFISNLFKC